MTGAEFRRAIWRWARTNRFGIPLAIYLYVLLKHAEEPGGDR